MTCDICQDRKRVRLIRHRELVVSDNGGRDDFSITQIDDEGFRDFPCPQCVPMVPYQKVRAAKVISEYDVDYVRRLQEPIKRSLAAAFGEYLLRNGLISFSTEADRLSGKIRVVAEMGAVDPEDAETAGARVDAVETDAPRLSPKLQRQLNELPSWAPSVVLQPEPLQFRRSKSTAEKVREVRESREGARDRFSGLELFQDDGEVT